MKIQIDWSEVKTTGTGKEYKKITGKDEQEILVEASVWSDAPFYAQIAPGATIEAEIRKSADGKYTNLVSAQNGTNRGGGAGMLAAKEKSIEKAQENKNRNIQAAQDRSAWMWAKNNAVMLIANHDSYKFVSINEMERTIEDLATKIYNFEPITPFNG